MSQSNPYSHKVTQSYGNNFYYTIWFQPQPKQIEVVHESDVGVVKPNDLPCEFCEQLIIHLRDMLVANTTEQEFEKVLEGLCKQTRSFSSEVMFLILLFIFFKSWGITIFGEEFVLHMGQGIVRWFLCYELSQNQPLFSLPTNIIYIPRWSLQFLVRVFTFLSLILWFSYFGTFLSMWSNIIYMSVWST